MQVVVVELLKVVVLVQWVWAVQVVAAPVLLHLLVVVVG
jgi:hypothetical protein